MGKKQRKKGEWESVARSREAAAKVGSPPRMAGVRMLSVEQAVRLSAGSGYKAKQRRRLGL